MATELIDGLINIVPKTKYLRSEELIALRCVKDDGDIPEDTLGGLKKIMPNGTEEEAKALKNEYEQLEKQLCKPRIERSGGRTLGEWDENVQAVRIICKDGKFHNFGYSYRNQHYLKYYEAIFLLEMNRLLLKYHGQIMSIEQAYLLLMGENASDKFSTYLVYSSLTRTGYVLREFKNIQYCDNLPLGNTESSDKECVWYLLQQELPSKIKHTKHQEERLQETTPNYHKLKMQFQQFKNQIMTPTTVNTMTTNTGPEDNEEKLNFKQRLKNNLKRSKEMTVDAKSKTNPWGNIKRHCNWKTTQISQAVNTKNKSLLDFLEKHNADHKTFEKFNIIPLSNYDDESEEEEEEEEVEGEEGEDKQRESQDERYKISFDVYLPKRNFRKSDPGPPDFRVIILKSNNPLPTHRQIRNVFQRQLQQITLVLMTLTDAKQVQAFLYYFS